jgi:aminoglycoside/choline kinase family phosphotransferase
LTSIPNTREDLSPKWFTSVLKLAGDNHVESVELQTLGEADSVSGDIYRVKIKYSNKTPDTPESVVVKLPRPRSLRTPMLLDAYRQEVGFYRNLAHKVGVPVPKHIYSDIDPATYDYVLVIEDYPDSTNVRNEIGATIEQAYSLVQYMAKFHSKYWENPTLLEYEWLFKVDEHRIDTMTSEITKCLPLFLSRFSQYIEPAEMEVLQALPEHYKATVKPLWFSAPPTLVHNDFAMKNILIIDGGLRFVLVDWANVGLGPGVRDLSFFVETSIKPGMRSELEGSLLRHYWEKLRGEGVSGYSFQRMFDDYRRSVIIDIGRNVRFAGRDFFRQMYEPITRRAILGRTGSAEELDLIGLIDRDRG